jgi:hypothetical protein
MKLKPTKRHLLALIELMATKQHGKVNINGQNRTDLFFGEPDVRLSACFSQFAG